MTMEWLSKALEFLKLPLKYIWAIVIAAGLLLFLPESALQRIHAQKFMQDFGAYIGLAFLVFGILLIIQLVSTLYLKISRWMARNKRLSNSLMELLRLDPSEKAILREFFIQNQNTLQLPIDQATVSGLITKGILTSAGSMGERSLAGVLFPVKMAEHIREHLKLELIDWPPEPLSEENIAFLRNNRPGFLAEIEHHNEVFHTTWSRRRLGPL